MATDIDVHLYASPKSWLGEPDEFPYTFCVSGPGMASAGWIPLSVRTLEFDAPTLADIKARHVVLLREKVAAVQRQACDDVAELQDQIRTLEALTYEPQAGS